MYYAFQDCIIFCSFDINHKVVSCKDSFLKTPFVGCLILFRFMSTLCMVMNVEWISEEKWVRWLLVHIGKKLIAPWALLKGAVLKYRLVKVYTAVTGLTHFKPPCNFQLFSAHGKILVFWCWGRSSHFIGKWGKNRDENIGRFGGKGPWLPFNKDFLYLADLVMPTKWQPNTQLNNIKIQSRLC